MVKLIWLVLVYPNVNQLIDLEFNNPMVYNNMVNIGL